MARQAEIRVVRDAEALAAAGAELFRDAARAAVEATGRFTVALAGGNTPRAMYERLAEPPFRDDIPWDRVALFWGDERLVPPEHPDSNYGMVRAALLGRLAVMPAAVHRMHGEEPNAVQAALKYEQTLGEAFALQPGELPRFDLVLLGLGEDGHTASLFPHTPAVQERSRLVVANWVPRLRTWRLTLTAPVLNHAHRVVVLASGASKAHAVATVLEGPPDAEGWPAQLLLTAEGSLLWLLDEAASSGLSRR